jgi:hypothetical protein
LRSTDPEVRSEAEHRHYSTILHQGSRYEASAYAVPFLLEILADPATPDRHRVVYLLTTLAVGYDESWLPHGFPIAAHRESAAGHRVDTEAERDYRRWILNHEVEDGWFPENAAATVPNLIRLVRGESDDGVAATALVGHWSARPGRGTRPTSPASRRLDRLAASTAMGGRDSAGPHRRRTYR